MCEIESNFVFFNGDGSFSAHAGSIRVCDRLWVVHNVLARQKFTPKSMRSTVLPKLRRSAKSLDHTNIEHIVDEDAQVRVFPN